MDRSGQAAPAGPECAEPVLVCWWGRWLIWSDWCMRPWEVLGAFAVGPHGRRWPLRWPFAPPPLLQEASIRPVPLVAESMRSAVVRVSMLRSSTAVGCVRCLL